MKSALLRKPLLLIVLLLLLTATVSAASLDGASASMRQSGVLQGFGYSPYRDCQSPRWGDKPIESQVDEDLQQLQGLTTAIRTYASTGIEGEIPKMAISHGLRVVAGASLGKDAAQNDREIAALIATANRLPLEAVVVGNETQLADMLPQADLIKYLRQVRAAVRVPVTTAEPAFIWEKNQNLIDEVDTVTVHIYPYWDGVPIENAAAYTMKLYHDIKALADAKGKHVIIGETGHPSNGLVRGTSVPGVENQRRYFREFVTLAQQEQVDFFYFSLFDELWKTEGGVGRYWGLMDSTRQPKFDGVTLLDPIHELPVENSNGDTSPMATGTAPAAVILPSEDTFPVFSNYGEETNHFSPSGWMGDIHDIRFSDCAQVSDRWDDRGIRIEYQPSRASYYGWAGIYWLSEDNNWGRAPSPYDLTCYTELRFRARTESGSASIKFFVGGIISGPHPSSIHTPIAPDGADGYGFVKLTPEWQEFHIRLARAHLSNVIDGFGWVSTRAKTPNGVVIYLDDIVYAR